MGWTCLPVVGFPPNVLYATSAYVVPSSSTTYFVALYPKNVFAWILARAALFVTSRTKPFAEDREPLVKEKPLNVTSDAAMTTVWAPPMLQPPTVAQATVTPEMLIFKLMSLYVPAASVIVSPDLAFFKVVSRDATDVTVLDVAATEDMVDERRRTRKDSKQEASECRIFLDGVAVAQDLRILLEGVCGIYFTGGGGLTVGRGRRGLAMWHRGI